MPRFKETRVHESLDPLQLLARIAPRKRRRMLSLFFGSSRVVPSSAFLKTLAVEIPELSAAIVAEDIAAEDIAAADDGLFYAIDVELDAIYAAFTAVDAEGHAGAGDPAAAPIDDRRGMMEMDGMCADAVLGIRAEDGTVDLVLFSAKVSGKWSGRRFRRLSDRLRRVFGEDGTALSGVRPHFAALGPERPGPLQTAAWPAWMRRDDGTAAWMQLEKAKEELRVVRCDRRGRPRRIGEFWKLA
jgi:hypothetical protein